MPLTALPIAEKKRILAKIAAIAKKLKPDVVRINVDFKDNWHGEPSLYLRVLLTDEAADLSRLRVITKKVDSEIWGKFDPFANWGLFPYVSFRSESEHAELKDQAWD